MFPPSRPLKLAEATARSAANELFIVEGDSAAISVTTARDPRSQAVLPLQGKPLNAWRQPEKKVLASPLFTALVDALGGGWNASFDPAALRYQRVLLLMDPDADGIHCGALMTLFFYRWMRPLVDAGRIEIVRAPAGQIKLQEEANLRLAYSDAQLKAQCDALRSAGQTEFHSLRYRGLAGIDADVLAATCLMPATRRTDVVRASDAELMVKLFGGAG